MQPALVLTANNEVGSYINIFRSVCQQFCPQFCWHTNVVWGGVCGFIWKHAWFYSGGKRGSKWGHTWLLFGGGIVWFLFGGHAWFYLKSSVVVLFGGLCVVLFTAPLNMVKSRCTDFMSYGQWAGSSHPTGMRSCLKVKLKHGTRNKFVNLHNSCCFIYVFVSFHLKMICIISFSCSLENESLIPQVNESEKHVKISPSHFQV